MTSSAWLNSTRRLAAALAMVSGFATPATAISHGLAHQREAHAEHSRAHASGDATHNGFELTGIDHDHPQIEAIPGTRVDLTLVVVVVAPAPSGLEPSAESSFDYALPDEVPRAGFTFRSQPLPRSPPARR